MSDATQISVVAQQSKNRAQRARRADSRAGL